MATAALLTPNVAVARLLLSSNRDEQRDMSDCRESRLPMATCMARARIRHSVVSVAQAETIVSRACHGPGSFVLASARIGRWPRHPLVMLTGPVGAGGLDGRIAYEPRRDVTAADGSAGPSAGSRLVGRHRGRSACGAFGRCGRAGGMRRCRCGGARAVRSSTPSRCHGARDSGGDRSGGAGIVRCRRRCAGGPYW